MRRALDKGALQVKRLLETKHNYYIWSVQSVGLASNMYSKGAPSTIRKQGHCDATVAYTFKISHVMFFYIKNPVICDKKANMYYCVAIFPLLNYKRIILYL